MILSQYEKNYLKNFLAIQETSLLNDFKNPAGCFVSLSPRMLLDVQEQRPWAVTPLPRRNLADVFVLQKDSKLMPECWVRWNYSGYRRAFKLFLLTHFSNTSQNLTSDFHVDHLVPQFRFSANSQHFVRLHLARARTNVAYGAGFERCFYAEERNKELPAAMLMDWLTYCKTRGVLPPGRNAGVNAWRDWARQQAQNFSIETGETAALAYMGLLTVLKLGYTGYYAGKPGGVGANELMCDFESQMRMSLA